MLTWPSTYTLLPLWNGWVLIALRLVLGFLLASHGWPKVKDLGTTATNFEGMGFKPGRLWGTVAAIVEFFGGVALILGIFMAPASLLIAGEFAVIVGWKLRKKMPFVGGWEFDILILVVAIALFFFGGGVYSLDRALNVPPLF